MSAFMSRPKPQGTNSGQLRTQIRVFGKQIRAQEDDFDEAADRLSRSLSEERLQADPDDVANEIADYMKDKQDGWGCDSSGQTFLFPSPYFEFLGYILIPQAQAEEKPVENIFRDIVGDNPNPSSNPLAVVCINSGGQWEDGECVCQHGIDASGRCKPAPPAPVVAPAPAPVVAPEPVAAPGPASELVPPTSPTSPSPAPEPLPPTSPTSSSPAPAPKPVAAPGPASELVSPTSPTSPSPAPAPKPVAAPTPPVPPAPPPVGSRGFIQASKCEEQGLKLYAGKCVSEEEYNCRVESKGRWLGPARGCKPVAAPAPKPVAAPAPKPAPVPETREQKCRDSGGRFENNQCRCPEGKLEKNGKCECPDWKKHESFRNNGVVKSKSFCQDYAKNKRKCREALKKMKNILAKISELESERAARKDELAKEKKALSVQSKKKTEAGGFCLSCLKKAIQASRPSFGQQLGNVLKIATGLGTSAIMYNVGQRAQIDANMLRMQDAYPPQSDYYALTGARAGFPFVSRGLYDMIRTNTPVGGWVCTPTVDPYGRVFSSYQQGQGFKMRYY